MYKKSYNEIDFIKHVKSSREKDVEEICIKELLKIRRLLKLSSLATVCSLYKKEARKKLNKDKSEIVCNIFKLTKKEYNQLKKQAAIKVKQVGIGYINEELLYKKTEELLQAKDYLKLCLGVASSTGRRTTEVLKTGVFKKHSEFELIFEGQLKKKDSVKPYIIPSLIESDAVIQAIKKIRASKNFSDITPAKVSRTASSNLGKMIKKEFNGIIEDKFLTPHSLRGAYLCACYQNMREKREKFVYYCTKILGHEEDDLETVQNYAKFELYEKNMEEYTIDKNFIISERIKEIKRTEKLKTRDDVILKLIDFYDSAYRPPKSITIEGEKVDTVDALQKIEKTLSISKKKVIDEAITQSISRKLKKIWKQEDKGDKDFNTRIEEVVNKVISRNEKANSDDEKTYINTTVLQKQTNVQHKYITSWIEMNKEKLEAHHKKINIGPNHNQKKFAKKRAFQKISDAVDEMRKNQEEVNLEKIIELHNFRANLVEEWMKKTKILNKY